MKPCFGYIRVSTQKQGEGVSLDAQKDAILSFASAHELRVIEWFEEKETAAKSGRPIFNRMLRDLRRGKANGLIMHKIDRSARNLRDWAIVSELPDLGVDVYIATETYDFTSRGGRLTADIQAVIAADYIRNLREESIKGLNGRLKQGLYPFLKHMRRIATRYYKTALSFTSFLNLAAIRRGSKTLSTRPSSGVDFSFMNPSFPISKVQVRMCRSPTIHTLS